MKTLISVVAIVFLGFGICFALDTQMLNQIRKEIESLENGAGDVWDYSGSGGYIFRFSQDILGDNVPEFFVNMSMRPNVWYLFSGSDPKNCIGDVEIRGSGFLMRRDGESAILLDTYEGEGLEKYILEQKITATGIQKSTRKVGRDATIEEYEAILYSQTFDTTVWVEPKMEGILLYDLLNQSLPKWFEFNADMARVWNGYYRIPNDEDKISDFKENFTPKVAIESLNQRLETSKPNDIRPSLIDTHKITDPTVIPITQEAEPDAIPSSTIEIENKPKSARSSIVLAAIVLAFITGILFYKKRR